MSPLLTLAADDVDRGLRRIEDAATRVADHQLAPAADVRAVRLAVAVLRHLTARMVAETSAGGGEARPNPPHDASAPRSPVWGAPPTEDHETVAL